MSILARVVTMCLSGGSDSLVEDLQMELRQKDEQLERLLKQLSKEKEERSNVLREVVKEVAYLTDGETKLAEFDVSTWREQDKQAFVSKCIESYQHQHLVCTSLNEAISRLNRR